MTRHFIYPHLPARVVVQVNAATDCITVRTFRRAGGALNGPAVLPAADVAALLRRPVEPFAIGRATPAGSWLPLAAFGPALLGQQRTGAGLDDAGGFLQEIAQTALVLDAAVLGRAALSERAEWVIHCDPDGALAMPENRTLLTWQARAHKSAIYRARGQNSVLTVMLPFADADFARAAIFAKMNPAEGLLHDFPAAAVVSPAGIALPGHTTLATADWRWPVLRLAGPVQLAADAFADFTVSLHDGIDGHALNESGPRVELESSGGYLAHRVLRLADGAATFRFGALGLRPGERLRLKAGWRWYPGLAEQEVAIV